ncbi:DUF5949 family protein [Streptomyces sp. H10-C2]|uniref:DUF5949 family protein n=1 Tax=unclassified Streptomyces TaxID=2593676 RepID=UPI0024BAB76C|nr:MULTISPECIES: DUF5949 family protein [unclassified Streptomyces]MDJ0340333.1 DUF5949 family protein [Streptomyces sp. PH10-H1]MDJ0368219.1 DUF5949 family protein [Streptomyces sp. H10-C2]
MSQTSTAPDITRQRQMGTLAVIPWAGEHLEDEKDIAFLLAYSLGDGEDGPEAAEEAIRTVLEEVGLPIGGTILDIAQVPRVPVKLLVEGGQAVLTMPYLHASCPAPDQWVDAARERGMVYFMFATRPWPQATPGKAISEEELKAFAGDEAMLTTSAHCFLPVGSLKA